MRIVADVVAGHVGEQVEDPHGILARTMKDGVPRTFIEVSTDYPHGIKQIVFPLSRNDTVMGALVLEYTPIYDAVARLAWRETASDIAATLVGIVGLVYVGLLATRRVVAKETTTRLAQLAAESSELGRCGTMKSGFAGSSRPVSPPR